MLLAFADESYRDASDRYFMAAVLSTEEQTQTLAAALDRIVYDVALNQGMLASTELHGYEVWHQHGEWRRFTPDQCIDIWRESIQAIVENADSLLWRGVDVLAQARRGYPDVWPPDVVAFQHLLERVNTMARTRRSLALVIRDEVDDPNASRKRLRSYREGGTPGYIATPLEWIIDTIHFAPSDHSRGLQAADMWAYLVCLHEHRHVLHHRVVPVVDELWAMTNSKRRLTGIWP